MRAFCAFSKILSVLGPFMEHFRERLGGKTSWCLQCKVKCKWLRNAAIFRSIFSHSLNRDKIIRSNSFLRRLGSLLCCGEDIIWRFLRRYSQRKLESWEAFNVHPDAFVSSKWCYCHMTTRGLVTWRSPGKLPGGCGVRDLYWGWVALSQCVWTRLHLYGTSPFLCVTP